MIDLQEVLSIKEKFSILKDKDKDFRVFGSSSHKYELFARLSETQIEKFERDNRLKLPADYRLFLTEIGNGGAGPFYGVCKFERAILGCRPSETFKWKSEASVEFQEDADFDEWSDHRRGIVEICEQGCGTYNFLVVNGSSYGEIWTDIFYELIPENILFIEFYNDWPNRNLERINKIPLLKSVKKGMTKTDLIGIFGNDYKEIKVESDKETESDERKINLIFKSVPATFSLTKDSVVEIMDYSNMLI